MKKFNVLCLILAIAMAMTGTARANYLVNPGFEDADPEPNNWTDPCVPEPNEWVFLGGDAGAVYAITYITDDPSCGTDCGAHGGDDYVKLDVTSYAWTIVYQEFNVAEEIDYRLKAWARANAYTMPSPIGLKLEFKDWQGSWIRPDADNLDTTADYDWAQYANDSNGIAPIGTRRVACTVVNLTDASIAYFDDLELTSTPDFASLDNCQKTQFLDGFDFVQGDLNRDCLMDLRDIAVFAEHWTECNIDPTFGDC